MSFLRPKIKVVHAAPDDKAPWSPIVVQVNRQRAKKARKRALILSIVASVVMCACCGAGSIAGYNAYMQRMGQFKPAQAKKTPAPTKTPAAGWTPVYGGDQELGDSVNYIWVTVTPKK